MTIPADRNDENKDSPLTKQKLLQEQLELSQKHLLSCLETLHNNPSQFTILALKWQQLAWWEKLAIGSLVCIPIVIGLLTQISSLSILGLSLLLFGALSLFFVNNHAQHHQQQSAELKSTALGFIKLLANMIEHLNQFNQQLGSELSLIKQSNKKLTTECERLHEEGLRLKSSNNSLDQNQQELLSVQEKLQNTIQTIDSTVSEQSQLLIKSQKLLTETTLAFQKNQEQLNDSLQELDEVKKNLSLEVDNAQKVMKTLKAVVSSLGTEHLNDQLQQEQFFQRLNQAMHKKEEQFDNIVKGLELTGQQLSETAVELKNSNQRFKLILTKQEEQMEQLAAELPTAPKALSQARQKQGFYAQSSKPEASTPIQNTALSFTG